MTLPPMPTYQTRHDLPEDMLTEIGRILVGWAHLEQHAQILVYRLLGIDQKQGRIAVQAGNLPARYEILSTLGFLQNLNIEVETVALKKLAEKNRETRDLLAHSIWAYSTKSKQWLVQLARGDKSRPSHSPRHFGKRRLRPAGIPMGTRELKLIYAVVDEMIRKTQVLEGVIDAQLKPSLCKRHSQSLKNLRSRTQKTKKQQVRRRSSPP